MKPREYQCACVEAICRDFEEVNRLLAVLPTGAGKTCIFSWLAQKRIARGERVLILAHREELIDQAIAKLKAATGIVAEKEKAEFCASLRAPVVVASVQSMIRRLDKWPGDHFGLIVADEAHHCFEYGTEVLTSVGPMMIGDIVSKRLKVLVASYDLEHDEISFKPVTGWFKNPKNEIITIHHSFGTLRCTRNHKVWTERGYVRAEDIISGMHLRVLPEAIPTNKRVLEAEKILRQVVCREMDNSETSNQNSSLGSKSKTARGKGMRVVQDHLFSSIKRKIQRGAAFLWSKMSSSVESLTARIHRVCSSECSQTAQSRNWHEEAGDIPANEVKQSDGIGCDGSKDAESLGWENLSRSWRERNPHKTATALKFYLRLEDGIPNRNTRRIREVSEPAELFQGRFRKSRFAHCCRDRRSFSQVKEVEVSGQEENVHTELSRVVSVTIQERRGNEGRSSGGSRDTFLYDIEVEDNHNYFADGVLVHNCLADSWQAVLAHFHNHAQVLGVTASPDRGDKRNLGKYFDKVAFEIGLYAMDGRSGLVEQGFLSPITVKSIPLKIDLSKVRSVAGDFNDADLGSALEPYLGEIACAIRDHASFRRVLAFLPLIATSQKFVEHCQAVGLSSCHIDGESPDRKEILQRYSAGEFDVLSNAMLLTEGYDEPSIDCVVMLRPTRSRPFYAQAVGRGTRICDFKENLLLLDFLWFHEKHDLVKPAHLIARDADEAEAITAKIEAQSALPADLVEQLPLALNVVARDVQHEREEKLKHELDEQSIKEAKELSPKQFAQIVGSLELATYQPVMAEDLLPVSDKQAQWLEKVKIDPRNGKIFLGRAPAHCKPIDLKRVENLGQASAILEIAFDKERRGIMMASYAQRERMRQLGADNWRYATEREAKQFFQRLNQRRKEPELI